MNRVDKLGTIITVNKLSIGITDVENVDRAEKPVINIAAKDSQRLLLVKQVAAKAFFFSFCKIICLFFSSLESESSVSLAISSMLSFVDMSIKQNTSSK